MLYAADADGKQVAVEPTDWVNVVPTVTNADTGNHNGSLGNVGAPAGVLVTR